MKSEKCIWENHVYINDNFYKTGCGRLVSHIDPKLTFNGIINYCPGCGKKVLYKLITDKGKEVLNEQHT